MSGNIISPVLQHNGAIVFAGERSLSAEDRKWRKKRIGIKVNLIFSMTKERFFWGGILKIVCFNYGIKAGFAEFIFFQKCVLF